MMPPKLVVAIAIAHAASGCAIGGGDETAMPIVPSDPMPVNCQADYVESFDSENGPRGTTLRQEKTNLILNGAAFTVCGELNPAFADANLGVVDQDFFAFDIAGATQDVRARVVPALPLAVDALSVRLWNSRLGLLRSGVTRGSVGVVTRDALATGEYLVSLDLAGELPAAPVPYTLTVSPDVPPCDASSGPLYVENRDVSDGHDNDVLAVDYTPRLSAQVIPGDAPEPTNLQLGPGQSARLRGLSGQVPSEGDTYFDRDTYEIGLGLGVSEIEVRLDWTDDGSSDLDVLVFLAGDPSLELAGGAGSLVGRATPETLTTSVVSTALWVFVGRAVGDARMETLPAVDYQLSICARAAALETKRRARPTA